MSRVFAVLLVFVATLQCYMHYQQVGYHHTMPWYWLMLVAGAGLIWDGFKLKK